MKNLFIISILILSITLTSLIFYQTNISDTPNNYFPKLSSGSTLEVKDGVWNNYTNSRLGFTVDVPNEYYHWAGKCIEENGQFYLGEGLTPIVAFEYWGSVKFIASQEAETYAGEFVDDNDGGRVISHNCKIIPMNQTRVNNDGDWWKFTFGDVTSEFEVEQFIKQHYGSSCTIGEVIESDNQSGVLDISIAGDGLDLGETECPVNFVYSLKYYPKNNRVMSLKMGQELRYPATSFDSESDAGLISYDEGMLNSFRFLEE